MSTLRANSQRLAFFACFLFWIIPLTQVAANGLPDFTDLVAANSPAVVNISSTQKISSDEFAKGHPMPGAPDSEMFQEFLRKFLERQGKEMPQSDEDTFDSSSLGSGFIISTDGYIVTNNHVIKDADEIIVRLSDRSSYIGKVIGTDPRSDVALLKIEAQGLPVLKIGSSDKLKVGEWVLAIGSPFGFEHSATAGIVSAKGRSLPSENYVPFIQTDVAINPGNSGGPLFNMRGEVVGINSQIYSRTGGFMGLSFAIPVEMAMEVVEQLKSTGHVKRGWLGVYIQEVTRELAESFNMDKPAGALVAKVLPDSPAEKAGFQVGDIILAFQGSEIHHSTDLPPKVGRVLPGQAAKVKVLREGKIITLSVTIEELPGNDDAESGAKNESNPVSTTLGLKVSPLGDEEKAEAGTDGMMVEEVSPGVARDAGVKAGDILVSINNKKVVSLDALVAIIRSLPPGKPVPMLINREGSPVFLALKIEAAPDKGDGQEQGPSKGEK
ncbi:MAG: DegQ family serine endoprotease [bacterium]